MATAEGSQIYHIAYCTESTPCLGVASVSDVKYKITECILDKPDRILFSSSQRVHLSHLKSQLKFSQTINRKAEETPPRHSEFCSKPLVMLQSNILAVLLALAPSAVLATPDSNDIPPIVSGVVSSALSLASSYASEYSTIPPDAQSAVSSALSLASSYESYGNSVASSALSLASSYASEYGDGGSDSTTTASVTSSASTATGTGPGTTTVTSTSHSGATATQASSTGGASFNKASFISVGGGLMATMGVLAGSIGVLAVVL